ncbi:MAG: HU family DNA-binding protein [Prevotella sp.]|nr:HU family DNA-binding protein [Bacteroides sp.]MCM1367045.1 HU family DNA-binding protein [Prevotella sp.]
MNCSQEDVQKLIEGLSKVIGDSAVEMDSVIITGFGAFEPRKRMERVAVQPSTGKRLLLPPKLLLGFRPSAILKQRIK